MHFQSFSNGGEPNSSYYWLQEQNMQGDPEIDKADFLMFKWLKSRERGEEEWNDQSLNGIKFPLI